MWIPCVRRVSSVRKVRNHLLCRSILLAALLLVGGLACTVVEADTDSTDVSPSGIQPDLVSQILPIVPTPPEVTAVKRADTSHKEQRCFRPHTLVCQAVHDRPVLALTLIQVVALASDGFTTRKAVSRGYIEINPVTSILIGRKPSWSRMAPLGTAQVIAETWLAERMKNSSHSWIRHTWWLPQLIGIAGNTWGTVDNIGNLNRKAPK